MTHYDLDNDVATDIQTLTEEPVLYHIIMHNDDYTTMDFVISVLLDIFDYDVEKAVNTMLKIHETGRAIVATLPKEIAEMRIEQVNTRAQEADFPLLTTLQEA